MLSGAIKGRQRSSYSGTGVRQHDERMAGILLAQGLKALGWNMEEVRAASPSDERKQGLIWLLRTRTTCGADWINRRLVVGHASNISRAMRAMNEPASPVAAATKRKLLICKD